MDKDEQGTLYRIEPDSGLDSLYANPHQNWHPRQILEDPSTPSIIISSTFR